MKSEEEVRKLRDFLIKVRDANPSRFMDDTCSRTWGWCLTWVLDDEVKGITIEDMRRMVEDGQERN
jgi:hypothetical protein